MKTETRKFQEEDPARRLETALTLAKQLEEKGWKTVKVSIKKDAVTVSW